MSTEDKSTRLIEELGNDLALTVNEQMVEYCLTAIENLEDSVGKISDPSTGGTNQGSLANDEYNSLLMVYDEPRSKPNTSGIMDDITFAVKDNIAVKNLEMTCGAKDFSIIPSKDATIVNDLLNAGGNLVGKANMEAFAFGGTGDHSEIAQVKNPIASDRITGGSSSGSAAAVAGGLVDMALGSDTGGSIRVPAACCGIVGVKPSHGLVSQHGFVRLAPSTDTVGPLTRDVLTAAKTMDVIAGYDPNDPGTVQINPPSYVEQLDDVDNLTISIPTNVVDDASDEVQSEFKSVMEDLQSSNNIAINKIELDVSKINSYHPFIVAEFTWLIRQFGVIRGQGFSFAEEWHQEFSNYIENHTFNSYITSRILPGEIFTQLNKGDPYNKVQREITVFKEQLNKAFETSDIICLPTSTSLPPKYEDVQDWDETTQATRRDSPFLTPAFSMAGNPVVSLPIGWSDNLPVSAQIVGPMYQDDIALQASYFIEQSIESKN